MKFLVILVTIATLSISCYSREAMCLSNKVETKHGFGYFYPYRIYNCDDNYGKQYILECGLGGKLAAVGGYVPNASKKICDSYAPAQISKKELLKLNAMDRSEFDRRTDGKLYKKLKRKNINPQMGEMVDSRDGKKYKTVKIGDQVWMAENLNFKYKVKGEPYGNYCNEDKCKVLGRYYTWAAAMDSAGLYSSQGEDCGYGHSRDCKATNPIRGICPENWHLPSGYEFKKLLAYLEKSKNIEELAFYLDDDAAFAFQATGDEWENATNTTGFSAIPAGYHGAHGGFHDVSSAAQFWSTDLSRDDDKSYYFVVHASSAGDYDTYMNNGLSVRCVKDDEPTRRDTMEGLFYKIKAAAHAKKNWDLNWYADYDLIRNAGVTQNIDKVSEALKSLEKQDKRDHSIAFALAGQSSGLVPTAKPKYNTVIKPTEGDIEVSGALSTTDVIKIARQRSPGLRHIYNKSIKIHPGLEGTVTLKFTIIEDGSISDISIKSSTTGKKDFNKEVKKAVSRWTFKKVDSGSTTVTIPFTFSENSSVE